MLKPPALLFKQDSFGMMAARDLPDGLCECVVDNAELYDECLAAFKLFADNLVEKLRLHTDDNVSLLETHGICLSDVVIPRVRLPCGGNILIEPCETLTAIDVNSSRSHFTHGRRESVLNVNFEAAREIARQMRLRDLGGVILIDFIDMDDEGDRQKVIDELELYAKQDRSRIYIDGFTKRGLLELTRKSLRCPIHKTMSGDAV